LWFSGSLYIHFVQCSASSSPHRAPAAAQALLGDRLREELCASARGTLLEEGCTEKKIIENVAPATVTFPKSDSYIRKLYIANARCVASSAQALRKKIKFRRTRVYFPLVRLNLNQTQRIRQILSNAPSCNNSYNTVDHSETPSKQNALEDAVADAAAHRFLPRSCEYSDNFKAGAHFPRHLRSDAAA
jgi:hypothetical protein